ncbi:hypothetical protein L843_5560 [Mycobacterium intracellulare MIN_061107_1834]|nr:hypothetical protein L843_5560 [Mycobacterium intracellulare MIN_061107_1834]
MRPRFRLGDQQFVDGAVEHGADDIEIVELDGVGVARPQADILPALITRPRSASIRWSSLAFKCRGWPRSGVDSTSLSQSLSS